MPKNALEAVRHPSAQIALDLMDAHTTCFKEAAESSPDHDIFWAGVLFVIAGYVAADLGQSAVEKMFDAVAKVVKEVPDVPPPSPTTVH